MATEILAAMDNPEVDERRLRRRAVRTLLGIAGVVAALYAFNGLIASVGPGSAVGRPAPAFDLPLLDGGGSISTADLDGRVAVLNVWASWCPPCREEAPAIARVHAASDASRVAFLGVVRNDSLDDAQGFVDEFAVPYPNVIGDSAFADGYSVRGLPMTFVIAADGTIAAAHFGPISESRLTALIEDALKSTSGDGTGAPATRVQPRPSPRPR